MAARFVKVTRLPDVFNTAPNAPSFADLAAPLVRELLDARLEREAQEREQSPARIAA